MIDVLVLGAGMAGVTAARELTARGFSARVLEARDRIGGRVHSIRDFGRQPIEAGAEFVHGNRAATWKDVEAAGLAVRPCPLIRDTLFNVGGRTQWLPWIIAHPGTWPTLSILRRIGRFDQADASAREFIERQGYRGRARVLAEMTFSAHLPGSVDEIGLRGLVEDGVLNLETGMNSRICDGYDRLPAFIAKGLDVDLGFGVEVVEWREAGVVVRATDGREVAAQAAVSTLPVGVLKSGRVGFAPELPASKLEALDKLEMGPVVKLLLRFAEPFWPRWAANIGCGTGPVTLYWPTSYRSDDAEPLLTAYATGPRAAELSKISEQEAIGVVLADLRRLFPRSTPEQALLDARRVDWSTDPHSCGGYTFLRVGGSGARSRLAAADTPPLFWAGSATAGSPIAATVEAAFTSGMRVAGEVARYLE